MSLFLCELISNHQEHPMGEDYSWTMNVKDLPIPLPKNSTLPQDANSKRFFIVAQAPAGGQQLLLAEHTWLGWCRIFIDRYIQVPEGTGPIG